VSYVEVWLGCKEIGFADVRRVAGNFYSIANESEHSAKLMFAQGCEPTMQVEQGAA
jgi:hypothetical protein